MLRLLKIILVLGCLAGGLRLSQAFSPLGPTAGYTGLPANFGDSWEVPTIGFNPLTSDGAAIGPKSLTEEYRRNTPVLYYAYDQTFLEYFGSNGVAAVDAALSILNSAFTNAVGSSSNGVDGLSPDLSEFPLDVLRHKDEAYTLGLRDLKSFTLHMMIEQMGLAQAERYIYVLHSRFILPGGTCENGDVEYSVTKRNYDPITFELSSYVNSVLYTYTINEYCTVQASPDKPMLADAVELTVDPVPTFANSSVAYGQLGFGDYYTGLTRDDVGGLRYLLRTNNVNKESAGTGITIFTTVTNSIGSLTTLDLETFLELLSVTDPATLQALYPNLNITSVTSNQVAVLTTNFVGVFTNVPWAPAGFPPQLIVQGQVVETAALRYTYTFDNVITNHFYTNWPISIQTVKIKPDPNAPAGSGILKTTTTSTTLKTNGGDFYILPPNVTGYIINSNSFIIHKGSVTNLDFNSFTFDGTQIIFRQVVTYFTNYEYLNVKAITLQSSSTNGAEFYQGVEKIRFVRRDFDPLLGTDFQSTTNMYSLKAVVAGGAIGNRVVRRLVTQPDFLFAARDMNSGPGGPLVIPSSERNINFNTANVPAGNSGPGTIDTPTTLTFNKGFPLFLNTSQSPDEGSTVLLAGSYSWASFDGTTNAPVVYPDATSLINLENQIYMQITTTSLPDGHIGTPYNAQLAGSGGAPPYTWELSSASGGLPPGLTLSPDGVISGTPTAAAVPATYDFIVRMTDLGARTIEQALSITITP